MKVLVVAGEASADLHAYHVLQEFQKIHPLELMGIGGENLIGLGMRPIATASDMAVVGLAEAIQKIPQTFQLLKQLESMAAEQRPRFALLLDLPDFNLRLAPRLKKLGIPVIYYISPQVWAWRAKRVHLMASCIDLLLTILPFEKLWYEKNAPHSLPVQYVGHPAIAEISTEPFAPEENHIVLMPGSRESEWRALFGDIIQAADILYHENQQIRFTLPLAQTLRNSALVKEYLSETGPYGECIKDLKNVLSVFSGPAHQPLRRAKVAIVASGTATLETAIVGTPMVVVYRVKPTSAFLFKYFIRYTGPISIVNLIHGGLGTNQRIVPEVLQNDLNPTTLAETVRALVKGADWETQKQELAKTRALLSGAGDPIQNVCRALEDFLRGQA